QWDGRRRSSRNEELTLPRLWQLPVVLRLAIVLVTMLVVTFLAYRAGPPMPYRVGEVYATDIKVRAAFEVVNQPQTDRARVEAVIGQLPVDQIADPAARERAALAVPPVVDTYRYGATLIRHGQPITEVQLNLLKQEHRAYLRSLTPVDRARRGTALLLIM